jgi:AraC-like DNA-binding protein
VPNIVETRTWTPFDSIRDRLLAATAMLAAGQPITRIALDLGYESPSAFTAMFRRALGAPPSHYFAGRETPLGPRTRRAGDRMSRP